MQEELVWTPAMTHDTWVAAGVVTAGLVLAYEKHRRGVTDERIWAIVALAVGCGAIGARLGTWLQHLSPGDNAGLVAHWLYGNRSIIGGLLAAYLAVLIGKRLLGVRWRTGALFAPAVAAGMAVGRIGCLLTEQPGTPTDLPWAVTVSDPADALAWGVPLGTGLHPSFVYEIAFHVLALVAIWRWRDRLADPADLFTLYVTGYAVMRFLVEGVRGNEVAWLGMTRPQLVLLVTIPLLLWRSVVALRRTPEETPHVPAPASA